MSEDADATRLTSGFDHLESSQRPVTATNALTAQEVRAWLISRIAERTGIRMQEIDIRDPFAAFGLVSREMVELTAELEDWLGRRLSPSLLYDYPSIEDLTQHLITQPGGGDADQPISGPSPEAGSLGEILAKLDLMSEAEVEALLENRVLTKDLRGG